MQTIDLQDVLDRVDTWRGQAQPQRQRHLPTASADLNRVIGGLPMGALSEMLGDQSGIGELSLLLPALVAAMGEDRWLVAIGNEQTLYGPALEAAGLPLRRIMSLAERDTGRASWAAEQCLRSGACGAVLLWADALDAKVPRRLQLAAEQGDACGLLFRPARWAAQPSAAALRLYLETGSGERRCTRIQILKQRGGVKTPELLWQPGF